MRPEPPKAPEPPKTPAEEAKDIADSLKDDSQKTAEALIRTEKVMEEEKAAEAAKTKEQIAYEKRAAEMEQARAIKTAE